LRIQGRGGRGSGGNGRQRRESGKFAQHGRSPVSARRPARIIRNAAEHGLNQDVTTV
jgi:hypothetical protein